MAKNSTPGARSVQGSSGGDFPTLQPGCGPYTPPGVKTFPKGSPTVEYAAGASTPSDDGLPPGSSVSSVPLTYTK